MVDSDDKIVEAIKKAMKLLDPVSENYRLKWVEDETPINRVVWASSWGTNHIRA